METKDIVKKVRKKMLTMYYNAHAGHIGSGLSCVKILVDIFFNKMKEGDIFILSKGHAACALYATLWAKGVISDAEIETYYKEGTNFAAHPPCNGRIPGIIFGTGSLGHGLSLAVGIAYANKTSNVYVVLSDGDCQEGQTWEAIFLASKLKLKNLHITVDKNDLQGLGVLVMDPIHTILNHDYPPNMLITLTTKGNGVSFMEHKYEWHYLPMSKEQYKQAMKEVENA